MIISRTPVRLSFFGGGTDYNDYFNRKPGATLGTTINKYTYISVNELSAFFEYKVRVGYSKSELTHTIEEIQHPSVRETLKYMGIEGYLDIHIFADLPAKTGLGSSSSFTVGFLNALYALKGKSTTKKQLADEAIYIEQQMIKENVGWQDQYHTAHGGLNIIEFDKERASISPVVISAEKYQLLNDSLLVFYTGLTRFATEIVEEQIAKTKSLSNDDYLEEMYNMVFEAENIISDANPDEMIKELGTLLHQSWLLKKNLSNQISNPMIDDLYDKALKAGAYGGKVAGAGGGGFVFFLVAKDYQDKVRTALSDYLEVNFKFEREGSKIIYLNP